MLDSDQRSRGYEPREMTASLIGSVAGNARPARERGKSMWSDFGVSVYAVLHHTRALCKRRQTAFKGFDSPGELFPLIPSGVPQTALQVLYAPPYRLCSG